jgi:UDP-N-acetylglucosamine transferase subunit ALG13
MYLGVLSRFEDVQKNNMLQIPDVLIIISGPEPQRGILQNKLLHVYRNSASKVLMVAGLPNSTNSYQDGSVKVVSHMEREHLSQIMQNVKVLICRSGYSSLMDLFKIKRKAILIPTPGQTEQVYLAKYFNEEYSFNICRQSDISSELQFTSDNCGVWNYSGITETNTLEESLKELLILL